MALNIGRLFGRGRETPGNFVALDNDGETEVARTEIYTGVNDSSLLGVRDGVVEDATDNILNVRGEPAGILPYLEQQNLVGPDTDVSNADAVEYGLITAVRGEQPGTIADGVSVGGFGGGVDERSMVPGGDAFSSQTQPHADGLILDVVGREPSAAQDVFVTEFRDGASNTLEFTAAANAPLDKSTPLLFHDDENRDGDLDDRGERVSGDGPNVLYRQGARADHPLADDIARTSQIQAENGGLDTTDERPEFGASGFLPEVNDEVLLARGSNLKTDTEVTDYLEGGVISKWEGPDLDAAKNEVSIESLELAGADGSAGTRQAAGIDVWEHASSSGIADMETAIPGITIKGGEQIIMANTEGDFLARSSLGDADGPSTLLGGHFDVGSPESPAEIAFEFHPVVEHHDPGVADHLMGDFDGDGHVDASDL